jgi:FAD synthase
MYLTSPQERARLLGELGIDAVVTLSFDLMMASLTAEEFMQKLVQALGFRELFRVTSVAALVMVWVSAADSLAS